MTLRKKLLFVNPASGVYGSERSMLALLKFRNFDAEVVCPIGGELEQQLKHADIKVYPLVFGKYALIQNPFWHVAFMLRFYRILKLSKPDILVINLCGNDAPMMLVAKLAGIPIVRYSRFEFVPPAGPLARLIDSLSWHNSDAVICPSVLVKQQVIEWAGLDAKVKVFSLYDAYAGIEATPEEIDILRKEFSLGHEMVIGCVARMHHTKKIETAIRSFANVRKRYTNTRLLIVGSDDGSPQGLAYTEGLKKLAIALDINDCITFAGYVAPERMPGVFPLMDVVIMPSETESFGMVLMEAWANGTPTVASAVSGCCEITEASGGGFVAAVGDADQIAERVIYLLENLELAKTMGLQGKEWVVENCSPSKYAERFGAIINHLPKTINK